MLEPEGTTTVILYSFFTIYTNIISDSFDENGVAAMQ
jgi:hypothetical protein